MTSVQMTSAGMTTVESPATFACGHRKVAENTAPAGNPGGRCLICKRASGRRYDARFRRGSTRSVQERPDLAALPVVAVGSWVQRAACRDPHGGLAFLFDPIDEDEDARHAQARISIAVGICQRCPVITDCVTAGSTAGSLGVWGGRYYSTGDRRAGRRRTL